VQSSWLRAKGVQVAHPFHARAPEQHPVLVAPVVGVRSILLVIADKGNKPLAYDRHGTAVRFFELRRAIKTAHK
jgi:hypothetical protein